ncbi:uncharacterized protein GLRG_08171 [Colletotrichum graminicola M1.001]|uniref:BTB domain-containing protein n=1 Tax=Colletotrichum graminicola (strain M1.001 / M2 / FGSC 10212) TaxID=645133 RepID=E3QQ89_COLGM|nr:uncharacterized protein GLRG_08171 [Colletotrichum graminicola M1.001]EFQ33027.1 hypothetical protein GLRG_08171 [Colletotrichum graminicola M1.001]
MYFKLESPQKEHVMEDSAAVTTTQDPTSTSEPDSKRRKLELPDPEPVVRLDGNGDLLLFVGAARVGQASTYLVCSKALSRSSPVMQQMISGQLAEPRPLQGDQGNRFIDLPDDQPVPMRLMLDIMHGDFQKVPQEMELQTLHALVIVMDKYDALSLARPWVKAWLASVRGSGDYTRLLSIAWALGDMGLFSTMTSRIVETCTISTDGGDLLTKSNIPANRPLGRNTDPEPHWDLLVDATAPLVPTSVIERMAVKRAHWILATIMPYSRLYDELKRGNCECRFVSRHFRKTMSPRCRALALGSLIQGFLDMEINITTANPTCAYKGSLESLMDRIGKLEILTDRNCDTYNHDECARMQEAVKHKRIASTSMTPLTCVEPDYRTHIRSQAKKTGLSG